MVINVNSVSINKNVDTVLTLNLHHTSDSVFPIHLFKKKSIALRPDSLMRKLRAMHDVLLRSFSDGAPLYFTAQPPLIYVFHISLKRISKMSHHS